MELNALTAISPIDGRYHSKTSALQPYFSEYGLIKYRVFVEVEYFIALCEIPLPGLKNFTEEGKKLMRSWCTNFTEKDALWIKETEKTTNHDVKAVEYFLKNKFDSENWNEFSEYIHFGLTSQDINNTAIPLSLKEALNSVYLPSLMRIVEQLDTYSKDWENIPMLARTHGQPASPTRLGKEMLVYSERLKIQINSLLAVPMAAKFGGATGNFNAHHLAFPEINWVDFSNHFVDAVLGLKRSQTTTQIEHYDQMAALFDAMKRINTILLDLSRDFWLYISMDYFKQRLKEGEIGSSAMPHKVNPIDFENAEGNIGIANAHFEHLAAKLPVSRLQRDLTDSTVLRTIGVPIAHALIANMSLQNGLNKVLINKDKINHDLEQNWAVVAEAIQTILRREGVQKPYELLKELTRTNKPIDKDQVQSFILSLDVNEKVKNELMQITPQNYTGI